jgi:hypothetical protein
VGGVFSGRGSRGMREILGGYSLPYYLGVAMLQTIETNRITPLIAQYKVLLRERGLADGIYKFKLIKKFQNHWDPDAPNFGEMVRRADFGNLVFPNSKGVLVHVATQKPNELNALFADLYDETIPLEQRIPAFQNDMDALYDPIKSNPKHKAWQEERAIATYLSFRYPEQYFLYKDSFYGPLCDALGVKRAAPGKKYLHYLELAKDIRNHHIINDDDLIAEVQKYLTPDCYQDPEHTVLTQDLFYTVFDKEPNKNAHAKEDYEGSLLNQLKQIGNHTAVKRFFDNLQALFDAAAIGEDNEQVYCTVRIKYKRITFSYGQRYIHYIDRKRDGTEYAFIMTADAAAKYTGNNGVSVEDFTGSTNMKFLHLLVPDNEISTFDFTPLLEDCIRGLKLEIERNVSYTFRDGPHKEAHNPLIYRTAMDEDFRKQIMAKAFNGAYPTAISAQNTQMVTRIIDQVDLQAKNIILYGPPGTGKTYSTIDLSVTLTDGIDRGHAANKQRFDELRKQGQIEFITFHQNYAYEDFVVGMRPVESSSSLSFKKHEGIFYDLCKRAEANYLSHKAGSKLDNFDADFETFIKPLTEGKEIEVKMVSGEGSFHLYDINETTIRFRKKNGSTIHTLSIGTLKEIYNGTRSMSSGLQWYYGAILRDMRTGGPKLPSEPLHNYVLIIDEINRANISKVFGELITLLEEDKRIDGENELRVTLPNGEKHFGVPPNLYLIGTMNTADKSIAHIDIALRRRFEFIGKYPTTEGLSPLFTSVITGLNKAVMEYKKSPDFLIGHGYFIGKPDSALQSIINNKVLPLLNEYFIGRADIITEVLKEAGVHLKQNTSTHLLEVA